MRPVALLILAALALPVPSSSAVLTADDAVKIALQKSPGILQAEASVLSARSGLWSAYSRVVPSVGFGATRSGSFTNETRGTTATGSLPTPNSTFDSEAYRGSYGFSGQWNVFDPSGIVGLSSARSGMKAADLGHRATRADVTFQTKRLFYSVVKFVHLSRVSSQALKLSRDDERRVRALFDVGSVSKSDLLRAQVRTAQSVLDSILADHAVTTGRISLAQEIGVPEQQLGEVDTTLAVGSETPDMATVLAEARKHRPDIQAADADARSAELELRSAHFARLPAVVLSGSYSPNLVASSFFKAALFDSTGAELGRLPINTRSTTKGLYSGSISLNLPLFDGFATDSRVAAARSRLVSATETRDALLRNLEDEVRQTLLAHQEAMERDAVGRTAVASARENLNLVQQKYNVGSATILDLIDAQVSLLQAASDLVSAMADIRIAEAAVDRVRGKAE
jgi:outer membrane protein TolC